MNSRLTMEPATAVDVVLWSHLETGRRAVVLLEVKLSEGNFSHCKGRFSRGNRRQDVCSPPDFSLMTRRLLPTQAREADPGPALLGDIREESREREAAFPNADLDGLVHFEKDMQQPMRNLAIARGLEQEGVVDMAAFALCVHDANPEIAAQWANWQELLPSPSLAPLIHASQIVGHRRI